MKKLLTLALVTSISLPLMAAETAPASTATKPGASSDLSLSTPIGGGVTLGQGLGAGAAAIAAGIAMSNSGSSGGNDSTPGAGGTGGTGGTTGTTGTTR